MIPTSYECESGRIPAKAMRRRAKPAKNSRARRSGVGKKGESACGVNAAHDKPSFNGEKGRGSLK